MPSSDKSKWLIAASALILFGLIAFAFLRDTAETISLEQLKTLVASDSVGRVIEKNDAYYIVSGQKHYRLPVSQVDPELLQGFPVERREGGSFVETLFIILMLFGAASLLLRYWMKHRTGGTAGGLAARETPNESETVQVHPVKSDVTFNDIGGISDVKEELEEIIDFLKNPAKYRQFGARLPKGVLLIGPPGIGKTMIAKAVAAEAEVPFYYQSASSFVHIYVGMGAKRVSALFRAAANNAPAIIFIDEIDSVGKIREGSSNDEREATLNQLLTEMDGFADASGIIVLAATNKFEMLDPALLRAGRFDRRIFVELPTPEERTAILAKYLRQIPHNVSSKAIAQITVGFNGAALAALVNEAALYSLRQGKKQVSMEDIVMVKEKVAFGKKRLSILNDTQKQCRAVYLAGKAIVATWFDLPFDKVVLGSESIRPTLAEPLMRHEIESHIRLLLAGKIMCDIRFREHTSSAKEDLKQALQLAKAMLFEYGMGTSLQPPTEELPLLLETLEKQTRSLLNSKDAAVTAVEKILLERETITKEQVKEEIDALL